ncbi:OmpP1/FadL family transporter [Desulforegula conservatrix]|uniref:OmpP1/FadL family transporter n=1 Tax=Desulforegula conservatrix TaxID=153026 RepID=UPI00040AE03F|nr:outer membrane protein transport protein [Desulforegula conservatrix]
MIILILLMISAVIFQAIFVCPVMAGNVDNFGIGSRAISVCGAVAACPDETYALFNNPGALKGSDRFTFSAGTSLVKPDLIVNEYSVSHDPYHQKTAPFSSTTDGIAVPHFSASKKINDRITAGVAAYVPFGLEMEWPSNPNRNPAAYNSHESYYVREVITPGMSFNINDTFSIGTGLSIGKAKTGQSNREYFPEYIATSQPVRDKTGLDEATLKKISSLFHDADIRVDLEDDANLSMNIGMLFTPSEDINLGITWRSGTEADFSGSAVVVAPNGMILRSKADTAIDFPQQIQAGVRIYPLKTVAFEADILWTEWSVTNAYHLSFSPAIIGMIPEISYPRKWEDKFQLKFGTEWQIIEKVTLRCGYTYDPSPIPDETFDFVWPDADRHVYGIGAGIDLEGVTVDIAGTYVTSDGDRIIKGESQNLNSSYKSLPVSMKAGGDMKGIGLTLTWKY